MAKSVMHWDSQIPRSDRSICSSTQISERESLTNKFTAKVVFTHQVLDFRRFRLIREHYTQRRFLKKGKKATALHVSNESAQYGSCHGGQAEGQCACAVAVVSGAAVLAGLNAEDGHALLGAARGATPGGGCDCPVQRHDDFGAIGGAAAAGRGVVGRECSAIRGVAAVTVENATRVAGESVQSSKTAGQDNKGNQSIHLSVLLCTLSVFRIIRWVYGRCVF